MIRRILLPSLVLVFLSLQATAQCPPNMNFSNGNLSYWTSFLQLYNGATKANTAVTALNTPPASVVAYNKVLEQGTSNVNAIQIINYTGASTPKDSIVNTLSTVPNINGYQYNYSIKLGDVVTKSKVRKLAYYINVPAGVTNYYITYAYALMLEDPGHTWDLQPRFTATVRNPALAPGQDTIKCASVAYEVPALAADKTSQGFMLANAANSIYYKDWTEVSVNLGVYAGETIILEFESDDCQPGGHFGYAYFTLRNDGCSTGSVTGNSIVCANGTPITYSTPSVSGSSYIWTMPTGWTGSSTTNSITVTPNSNSGYITVTPTQSCGNISTRKIQVTTTSGVPSAPGIITGPTSVCSGSGNLQYSIAPVANASSYTWTLPSGWSIVSGADSATIVVNATSTGGTISVVAKNGCGASAATSSPLTIQSGTANVGGVSSGGLAVCSGTNVTLNTTGNTGAILNWQSSIDGGVTWINISNSASATYIVSKPTVSALYRVAVQTSPCSIAFSTATAVTINALPAISYQPASVGICANGNASFSVVATGGGITYQWQVSSNGGTSFSNVANTAPYSNATTGTLTLTSAGAGLNNYQFRCIVTGTCGSLSSNTATLSIGGSTAPVIVTQPSAASICVGSTSNLSIAATGTNLTYQWYSNSTNGNSGGTLITGATSANISVSPTSSTYYYCVVSSTCSGSISSTSSNAIQIAVGASANISVNINVSPSAFLCPNTNTNVVFTATPTNGGNAVYAWTKNNVSVGTNSFTYQDASLNNNDVVAVSVTSDVSCAINNPANASITMVVAPPTISGNTSVCIGATTNLTGAGTAASSNPWMSADQSIATVDANGVVTGVSAGTTTIIYTSNTGCSNTVQITVKSLPAVASITGIAAACIGNTTTLSNLTAGGSWSSADNSIATVNSATGVVTGISNGTVNILYTTANDNVTGCSNTTTQSISILAGASISFQPSIVAQTACVNSTPIDLSVTASGTGLTYQWYSNTTALNSGGTILVGATNATYTPSTAVAGTLYYYCLITNSTGCTVTSNASAAVNVVLSQISFTTQPVSTVCANTNIVYTTQTAETNYIWTVPGTLNIDYQIISGGIGSSNNTVTIAWLSAGSKTVTVKYTNAGGCGGSSATPASSTTTVALAPSINTQPSGTAQTVCQNSSTTAISLTATGTGLIYQWFSNSSSNNTTGTYIDGARANSYTPSSASAGTTYYYATVSNANGCSITSNVSGLVTVNALPVITAQPSSSTQSVCQGTVGTPISVTATGTGLTYQWYRNTTAVNTGGTLISAATSNSYTPPNTLTAGVYYFYCTITNASGCSVSTTVSGFESVSNTSAPQITTQPVGGTYCSNAMPTLSVVANSGGANGSKLTYQWYRTTATALTGATSSSYTVTSTSARTYYVIVTNSCATSQTTTSSNASITINRAPTISTHPAISTQTICQNATATALTISASVSSGTITYQWYMNTIASNVGGTLITGATATSYTPTTYSPGTYYYYCIATANTCSTISNVSGAITVNPSVSMQVGTISSIITTATSFSIPYTNTTGDHYSIAAGSPALSSFSNVASTVIPSSPISVTLPAGTKTAGTYNFALNVTSTSSSCSATYTIPLTISSTTPGNIGTDQNICINPTTSTYNLTNVVSATTGSTYQWQSSTSKYTGFTNISGATSSTYTVPIGLSVTTYYRRAATASSSTAYTDPVTIKVGQPTIITLTSGTISPSVCKSTALKNIVFQITGDITGVSLTGTLPTGVTGVYDAVTGLYTIRGTPTTSGSFSYTLNTTGACTNASTSGTITVNALPAITYSVSPAANNCKNSSLTYTTLTGQTNYTWSFTGTAGTDYTISSGGTSVDNSVTLQYLTYGNKTVSINYTDANGCTAASATSNTTTINQPIPSFVSAPTNTCNNTTSVYTTQTNKSNYIWTISGVAGTDYSVVAGAANATSNTVSLNWLTTGTKSVEVYYTDANSCVAATSALNTITVNALPVASFSAAPTAICVNSNATYTTLTGQSNYTWTVPGTLNTDYQIVSGSLSSTSNTVTIKWLTSGTKNVNVNYNNASGCASATAASVNTVVTATTASFTVSPSANSCINSNLTYTAPSGNSNYTWTVPGTSGTDYTIVSGGIGTTNNTVTLKWLTSGSKSISINYTANGCSATVVANATTTIQAPTVVFSAQPNSSMCGGTNATYTIQSGNTNYLWTVPGILNTDYTVVSGGGSSDNSITIQWLTAGNQYVSALYTDQYGCITSNTASTSKAVYVPTVNFGSNASASNCVNNTIFYSSDAGNNNYVWSIPGFAGIDYNIIAGGTSADNTASIQWLKPGTQNVSVYYTDTHSCTAQTAAIIATVINDIPSIHLGYVTQVPTTATSFNIPYQSTTGFPDQFSINVGSPAMSGFSNITNQILLASPLTISIPASNANTYQFNFTVTNAATGCSSSNYTIPLVVTNINPGGISSDQTICSGSTPATFTSSSDATYYATATGTITYQWQMSTGSINAGYIDISGATDKTYTSGTISQTTYFRRKATDGSSDAFTDPITVNVNDLPIPLLTSTAYQNICANSSVTYGTDAGQSSYIWTLSGTSGVDYTIVSGGTSSDKQIELKWLTGGTKTISINYTDANGCAASTANNTTTSVNAVPLPVLNVDNSSVCVGSSAIVTYTTDASKTFYAWDLASSVIGRDYQINAGGVGASSNTVTIQWLTTGSKRVGINYTDADGCSAVLETSVTTTVSAPNPSLNASTSSSICANSNITYTTESGKSNYVWTFPNSTLNVDYTIVSGGSSSDNTVVVTWKSAGVRSVGINYTDAGCSAVSATTVSNIVYAIPTISIGSYTTSVPVSTISNFNIPYSATTQSPDKYSVDGSALTGFTSLVNNNLPVSPITLSIPSITEGSYTLNLTVKNSTTGCVSINYPIQVIVTNVNPGSISGTQAICSGSTASSITSTTTATGAGSITYSWQYSTTSATTGFTTISNATGTSYSPGALTQTTYFRRGASDASTTAFTAAIAVTVNPNPSLTLNSSSASQTICANTAMSDIVFTVAGSNNASASNLPTGINGRYNSYTGLFTISGIPTASGSTYTVTATSANGCTSATANGTITVTALNTISLSSAAGTDAQTKCANTAITNITYTTTGATGATISGLPSGVSGNWSANAVTISGTPTVAGNYTYTITLTGGCGTITKTGTMVVNALPVVTLTDNNAGSTICANTSVLYSTSDLQSNYNWNFTGTNGVDYILNAGGTSIDNTASVTWLLSGNISVSVNYIDANGCTAATSTTDAETVIGLNTITLNSALGTDAQTVCANSPITDITYATTGATDGNVTGLPSGLTGSWTANVFTITGTPTASGVFNYTVTLAGGCGIITASGMITVTPDNTVSLSSAAGTDAQTVCANVAITTISYATTGATGATVTGLPNGVTDSWTADVLTITGTPTVSGTFNYTVTLTGGCGVITTTGTITVNALPSISVQPSSSTQNVCLNSAATQLTVSASAGSGSISYQWYSNASNSNSGGTLLSGATSSAFTPSSASTGVLYYYVVVSNSNGCTSVTSSVSGSVTVNALPSISVQPSSSTQAICLNATATQLSVTATAGSGTISYQWYNNSSNSNSGGTLLSGATSSTYTPSSAAAGVLYYYVVVSNSNGCSITSAVSGSVTVNTLPTALVLTGSSVCVGNTTTITSSSSVSGVNYQLYNSLNATVGSLVTGTGSGLTWSGISAGTGYYVKSTNSSGCTVNSNTVNVVVNALPTAAINTPSTTVLNCTTTSIGLTATGGGTYSWSDGTSVVGTSATLSVTSPATYTVTVTSANGCTATASQAITQNITAPTAAISTPSTTVLNCTITSIGLTATGGGTYSWSDGTSVVGTSANLSVTSPATYSVTVTSANGCTATASQTITQNITAPTATINTPTATELNCTTTSISLTATGGGTYSWSDGTSVVGTSATLSVTSPATYSVTVTSANGCTATASQTITQNITTPTAVINTPTATELNCTTTSIGLTATGGGTYSWSDGTSVVGTSANLSVTSPATYTVTVTSANGCTATASQTITQNITAPTAAISTPSTTVLNCTTTSISLTATGGGTYSWSDGTSVVATSANLSVTSPATYTVTVTSANGCTATASQTITQNITAPTAAISTPSTTVLNCTTTSISLTATGGGTYSWSDGTSVVGTSATLSVTSPATYTVTVTSANGCTATASQTITQNITAPTAAISTPSTTVLNCTTTSISLTATGGGTYSWSDGTSVVATSANLSVTSPAIYTVTVTGVNGCTATASQTITQNSTAPTAAINTASTTVLNCTTTSIGLTATGGGTYSWSDGTSVVGTSATLSVTSPATYTVTVTSANGCTATASQTITQNITAPTAAITTPAATELNCTTTNISLTANGGTTYSWSNGISVVGTGATFSVTTPGTYTVTVSNANGCSSTANQIITQNNSLPIVTATSNQAVCAGASVTLIGSGAISYVWNNGVTDGVSFVPTQTTTYTVTGTDANGCANIATTTITVNTIPTITISPASATIAYGSSIHLSASGATNYHWLPSAGLSVSNLAGVDASPIATITYTVTGVDANGCSSTANILISVDATPATVTINTPLTTELNCTTKSISLTASGIGTYSWSDGTKVIGTNAILTVTTPGTYTVTATNSNGNSATASKTITQNISIPNTGIILPPAIEFSATNSSIKLIAKGMGTYSWTDGVSILGTIDTFIVTNVGIYSVTITGNNGCSATSDFITIKPVAPTAIPATFIEQAISNPSDVSHQVIVLSGARVAYYNNSAGGTEIPVPALPVIPGVYTYYVSQIINNIQSPIVPLTVTILPPVKVADIEMTVNRNPLLQSDGSFLLSFSIQLNNLTNNSLDSMMVSDDLTRVFSSAMPFQIVDIKASGSLIANRLFDGNVNQDLLLPESKLAGNENDSILLIVKFFPNGYVGQLKNSSIMTTKSAYGIFSMTSNDPTINNNINSRMPTVFSIPLVDIVIPTGFSPNRDGINDYFVITKPFNTTIQLEVFNRWGNLVYKLSDYQNTWDGRGNQPGNILGDDLTDGTYYYVVNAINNIDGSVRRFVGYITLKR